MDPKKSFLVKQKIYPTRFQLLLVCFSVVSFVGRRQQEIVFPSILSQTQKILTIVQETEVCFHEITEIMHCSPHIFSLLQMNASHGNLFSFNFITQDTEVGGP